MSETAKPISKDVAYVAFDGDRPCLLLSAEPNVLFDTFISLLDDPGGEIGCDFDEDREINLPEARRKISELRWELHPVEQAKEIFRGRSKAAPARNHESHERHE